MLTKTRLIEFIAGGVLLLVIVGSYLHSRETSIRADAEHQANQVLQTQLQRMREDVQSELAQQNAIYQQDTQSLKDKFDQASKKNAQMLALISQTMRLPVPPAIIPAPPPTKENPNPVSTATISAADLPAVAGYVRECEQCKLDRDKAKADLGLRLKDMDLAQKQIDGLKHENQKLLVAAHGTFWQNAKKAVKWISIGAVAGGVALGATGHIH